MAVVDPQTPNLAPAYGNIINTINQQAERSSRPRPMSTTGALLTTAADTAADILKREREKKEQEDLLKFKFNLEDKVNESAFERDLKKQGKTLTTQADIDALAIKAGVDPAIAKDIASPLLNKYMTAKERMEYVNEAYREIFNEDLFKEVAKKDPVKAKALRATGPEGAKTLLTEGRKSVQKVIVPDSTSSTGFRWGTIDNNGETQITDLEAPKELSKRSGGPDDESRLRREFDTRVDKIGYNSVLKAKQIAENAEKNVSISNDMALTFAVAQAREPASKLTDQDFRAAAEAGSLAEDLQAHYNKIKGGKKLADNVRKSLVSSVKQAYAFSDEQLNNLDKEYKDIAKKKGLDIRFSERHRVPAREFDSIEDAEAANLEPGTLIKVGGKAAIWE